MKLYTIQPSSTHPDPLQRGSAPASRPSRSPRWLLALAGLLALLLLSACQPVGGRGQLSVDEQRLTLLAQSGAGQTFTATFNGLAGLRLHLQSAQSGSGKILLDLYSDPARSALLAQAEVAVADIGQPGFYTFVFPSPLAGSANRDYYLELRLSGEGFVSAGAAGPQAYADGSAYQAGQPLARQLAFMPVYDPRAMAAGLARELLTWAGWLLALVFACLLPGWALLDLLAGDWPRKLPFGSRVALAAAAGLAIYPVLFLFTALLGLKIGSFLAFAPGAAGLAWLACRQYQNRAAWARFSLRQLSLAALLPGLAYLLAAGLVVCLRLWAVRTLAMPLWGDSVHHTMITELIVRNNGLFDSWQPLAELQTFTYHFGFHVFAAVLHWLTGLQSPQAVIVAGQLFNALAVLGVYPLAARAARQNPWAGAAAVVAAGCLMFMPMFYTNWGRYTQLAGQAILCAAVYLLWEMFENQRGGWKMAVLVGLVWGGLGLTHYRVMIFAVLAVPAFALFYSSRLAWRDLWQRYRFILAAGLLAGLLFLPWFIRVYGGAIYNQLVAQVTTPPQAVSDFGREYNGIGALESYLPARIWALAAFAAAWGLYRRQREVAILCIWAILVLFAANPGWFGLPGSGALSNFAIFIAAYIFAGALLGAAFGWAADAAAALLPSPPVSASSSAHWAARALRALFSFTLLAVLLGAGLYFGRQRLRDLSPETYGLITRSDLRAAAWIQANTPADARIAVNSFFAYGGAIIVGADGGWWLPQVANRQTNLPPMLYTTEIGPYPGYIEQVNGLRRLIEEQGYTSPEAVRALWDSGVRYAFIGQQGGRVNYAGPVVMDPEDMTASGYYRPVYHQDRVWVLELPARP